MIEPILHPVPITDIRATQNDGRHARGEAQAQGVA